MVRRIVLLLLVAGGCVGCDQLTKGIARDTLSERGPVSYFGDAIRFQYEENSGAMLSVGAGLPEGVRTLLLTGVVGVMLCGFALFALLNQHLARGQVFAFALLVGGGLGNLMDRLMHNGVVIDFLIVGVGPVRTAVFNLADVVIMAGVLMLLLFSITRRAEPLAPGTAVGPVSIRDDRSQPTS